MLQEHTFLVSLRDYLLQLLDGLWLMQAPGVALMGVGPVDQVVLMEQLSVNKALRKRQVLR